MRSTGSLLAAIALVGLIACADTPASPSHTADGAALQPNVTDGVQPLCQAGCIDPPPPEDTASGYYLGSAMTLAQCTNGSQTDGDLDGLSDFCEKNLAAAFAPELVVDLGDNTGGEPQWVAHLLVPTNPAKGVRIGYLLSYYIDAGSPSFGCTIPIVHEACGGHNGDSEVIWLDVNYSTATSHWKLVAAHYSQHTSVINYWPGECTFVASQGAGCVMLEFPDRFAGYPRAYVAFSKHGSYATTLECHYGGTGAGDECTSIWYGTRRRVAAGGSLNLGSRQYHSASQDSIPSANSSYQYVGAGRFEAYWTYKPFRGWIPDYIGGASATAYSSILASMGF